LSACGVKWNHHCTRRSRSGRTGLTIHENVVGVSQVTYLLASGRNPGRHPARHWRETDALMSHTRQRAKPWPAPSPALARNRRPDVTYSSIEHVPPAPIPRTTTRPPQRHVLASRVCPGGSDPASEKGRGGGFSSGHSAKGGADDKHGRRRPRDDTGPVVDIGRCGSAAGALDTPIGRGMYWGCRDGLLRLALNDNRACSTSSTRAPMSTPGRVHESRLRVLRRSGCSSLTPPGTGVAPRYAAS
jgi:hypothetical protein